MIFLDTCQRHGRVRGHGERQLITRVLIFRENVDVPRSPVIPSPKFLDTGRSSTAVPVI